MPYSPPAGSAAHFSTSTPKFPVGHNELRFKFGSASYTAPVGNDIDAQFPLLPEWVAPAGNAANFSVLAVGLAFEGNGAVTVEITAAGSGAFFVPVVGNGAVSVEISAAGVGETYPPATDATGAATVPITAGGAGSHGVAGAGAVTVGLSAEGAGEFVSPAIGNGAVTVDLLAEGVGTHGVGGAGAVTVGLSASGTASHGVAGQGAATIDLSAAGVGHVERYELRGEVRKDGILVNRLVRAYRRDSGELVGEGMTVFGKFRIHVGFAEREHYIVPIDTANDAADWSPPCANRVLSILAQDVAA